MSDHYKAVLHALHAVQTTGDPVEIGSVYADRLPLGVTLDGLVQSAGLTMKISKSTSRAIIEKPFWRKA